MGEVEADAENLVGTDTGGGYQTYSLSVASGTPEGSTVSAARDTNFDAEHQSPYYRDQKIKQTATAATSSNV